MKANKAMIVQSVDGVLVVSEVAIENLEVAAAVRGASVVGVKTSRRIPLREEIEGQPMFDTLVGPMYGGEGIVRYEDRAAHAQISA